MNASCLLCSRIRGAGARQLVHTRSGLIHLCINYYMGHVRYYSTLFIPTSHAYFRFLSDLCFFSEQGWFREVLYIAV